MLVATSLILLAFTRSKSTTFNVLLFSHVPLAISTKSSPSAVVL
ncbi:MAG: hypothetical protein SOZ77_06840 [Candidatus Limousia pullorum]|nr:hypothetical protein [Candidatus Limousia pullorum]